MTGISSPTTPDLAKAFDLFVAQGASPGWTNFEKFGRNPAIATNTDPEDVWNGGGDYTGFPTGAAETMEIFSGDDNDTDAGDGGTGARTVTISFLLDGDKKRKDDVTVSLAGQTPVSLGAQTYSRATRIAVTTCGSGGANLGTLTLRHTSTTANIFAVMPIGYARTTIAAFTVPAATTLYLTQMSIEIARAAGAAAGATATLMGRPEGGCFQAYLAPELTTSGPFSLPVMLELPAKTDLKVRVELVSSTISVTSHLKGYLKDL